MGYDSNQTLLYFALLPSSIGCLANLTSPIHKFKLPIPDELRIWQAEQRSQLARVADRSHAFSLFRIHVLVHRCWHAFHPGIPIKGLAFIRHIMNYDPSVYQAP